MKSTRMFPTLFVSLGALLCCATLSIAGGPNDPDTTAKTLVTRCAGVNQGEAVFISGRPTDMPLLESIAVQVRKMGAFPLVAVGSDRMEKRLFDEVPPSFDSQINAFDIKLAGLVNAMINIESTENPSLFAGASPARLAARATAGQAVEQAFFKNNVRRVSLGNGLFPTQATASMYGIDKDQLAQIFWSGVNTDYAALQSTGSGIKSILESGHDVHIINPNGTDLTFKINSRPCFVSDGVISKEDVAQGGAACQVWLPAGEVYGTPVPGSTNGHLVFDRVFYQGKEITGVTLDFHNGVVTNFTGGNGFEAIKALFDAAGPGKDEFAFFDLGINPDVKIPAGSHLLSWVPAGMVSLGIGSNTWAGGANNCGYSFSGFLPGSTFTVDNSPLIAKGMLRN